MISKGKIHITMIYNFPMKSSAKSHRLYKFSRLKAFPKKEPKTIKGRIQHIVRRVSREHIQ